ncbi:fatty acid hydroxylase family protein [Sphingorhabdus sp. IMCC26285]|jgi:lathosterol oxidase|uniref:Fatty acid hydroxylase family protein n=1 Tax=Sphingorhabdus profundilacus TaxID=2509718 RepID=A0A6I4LWY5_9SPHN|nr:sterol desaturase family protein [Sphingorhabdus profundilacus]MVZ96314.1 fatty acid hydroxylase family protein [Sphingorhabdus profundilacus]
MEYALTVLLSALAMTLIVGVRYLVVSGAFAWATRVKYPKLYAGLEPQMRREIGWSLASAAIYGIPAGIVAWGWDSQGWTLIYRNWSEHPLWYVPLSIVLYLIAHDSWFYWTHRLMHRPWWFKKAHAVHHESRPPTAWAAMSFHPWEALTGALIIPILTFIIPIHVGAIGVVLTVMTVMGVTNHMGWELFPRFMVNGKLGKWLITATHHQKHHEAYRGNYGLYFRFWDKICGTDLGLGDWGNGAGTRNST